jgi:Xaa-Pro dipeptidase
VATSDHLEEPFSPSELNDRVAKVQADLAARGLAAGVLGDPENIFWLTGYRSIGYFTFQALVVPRRGLPVLVTRVVNGALGRATRSIGRCDLIGDSDDPVTVLAGTLDGLVGVDGAIGVETSARAVAACDVRALERLQRWRIEDWNGTCEAQRRCKSPAQLQTMRRAADAAVAGLDAAVRAVQPGATENDVAAAMIAGATRAGSEYFRTPLVVAGPATALCFTNWERRRIAAGDVVLLESAACVHRHHAVVGRTAVVGRPLPEHRRVADALLAMLEAGMESLKPGMTSGEVHAAAQRKLVEAGFEGKVPQRLAYAVGVGFPPNWAEGHFLALRAGDRTVIEPGMTFHMIPSLFTESFGMWFSETVAVTERGCEPLTHHPRALIEIDPTDFPLRSLQ